MWSSLITRITGNPRLATRVSGQCLDAHIVAHAPCASTRFNRRKFHRGFNVAPNAGVSVRVGDVAGLVGFGGVADVLGFVPVVPGVAHG